MNEITKELIAAAPELLSAAVELQAALKEEAKERGGPWVVHRVSRDTQKRVVLAHQALIKRSSLLSPRPRESGNDQSRG